MKIIRVFDKKIIKNIIGEKGSFKTTIFYILELSPISITI